MTSRPGGFALLHELTLCAKGSYVNAFLRFTFHVNRIGFRLVKRYGNFGHKLLSNRKRESSEIFAAPSVYAGAGNIFLS